MILTTTEEYAHVLLVKRAEDMREIIHDVLRYGNSPEIIHLLLKTADCCKSIAEVVTESEEEVKQ